MIRNIILILLCTLTACAGKSKRTVLPALTLLLTATATSADVTFTAEWDIDRKDSADYDYVLYIDTVTPPEKVFWRGRSEIANGRMKKTFLFSETKFPIVITQLCGSVRAEHRGSTNTNSLSNVVCLPVDYTTPSVVTNFTLTAE